MIKKLKPVQRRIVSFKEQLDSSKMYMIRSQRGTKELIFDKYIKDVSKNKEILKGIRELKGAPEKKKYIDIENKIRITKKISDKEREIYKIEIMNGKQKHTLILKEKNYDPKNKEYKLINTTNELIVSKLLEKNGIKTIKPHLVYSTKKKGYIVYDFTNLITLENAEKYNRMSPSEKEIIENKVNDLQSDIAKRFTKKYSVWDYLHPNNIYIDLKTKEIYFHDVMSEMSKPRLIGIAKKELGFVER